VSKIPAGFYPPENLQNLTIDIIDTCNLACRLCYTESTPARSERMSTETVLTLLERVKSTVTSVAFTGGEPFLHPGLPQICQAARAAFDEVSVLTNATDISDEQLDWIASLNVKLGISIDGREPVHDRHRGRGAFQKSVRTMLRANARGIRFWIQTILGDFGDDDLEYIVQLAEALGAFGVAFQRPKKVGRAHERNAYWMSPARYREIVRAVHALEVKYPKTHILIKDALYNCEDTGMKTQAQALGGQVVGGCRAGLTYLYVKTNGDVLMCPFVGTVVGNIYAEDIYEIWSGGNDLDLVRSKSNYKVCSSCENFSVCRGCRAEALSWTGDLMGEDPNCWQKLEKKVQPPRRYVIPIVPAG
jgi:radical SAM protein with 4Fe4S-binding SPASM domain